MGEIAASKASKASCGTNELPGGNGNDSLSGGLDHDTRSGGAGDGEFKGGHGYGRLIGGLGADVLRERTDPPTHGGSRAVFDGGRRWIGVNYRAAPSPTATDERFAALAKALAQPERSA
jgi:hypothetical protein